MIWFHHYMTQPSVRATLTANMAGSSNFKRRGKQCERFFGNFRDECFRFVGLIYSSELRSPRLPPGSRHGGTGRAVLQVWFLGYLQGMPLSAATTIGAHGHPAHCGRRNDSKGLQAMPKQTMGAPAGGAPRATPQTQCETQQDAPSAGH